MPLKFYILIHVLISLMGIVSGLVVLVGMLTAKRLAGWTAYFLTTNALTSVTGFFFPFHGFTPALATGIFSLAALVLAVFAFYARKLASGWRKTYVISALVALYANVFVLIVQSFQKIPALKQLAPTQSEPPFKVVQLLVLALFIICTVLATITFKDKPAHQY